VATTQIKIDTIKKKYSLSGSIKLEVLKNWLPVKSQSFFIIFGEFFPAYSDRINI